MPTKRVCTRRLYEHRLNGAAITSLEDLAHSLLHAVAGLERQVKALTDAHARKPAHKPRRR